MQSSRYRAGRFEIESCRLFNALPSKKLTIFYSCVCFATAFLKFQSLFLEKVLNITFEVLKSVPAIIYLIEGKCLKVRLT